MNTLCRTTVGEGFSPKNITQKKRYEPEGMAIYYHTYDKKQQQNDSCDGFNETLSHYLGYGNRSEKSIDKFEGEIDFVSKQRWRFLKSAGV